jgi:hypothetical protein
LLHLSCEITALEKQLDELDEADSKTSTKYRLRRNEHYEGWDPAQKELIDKLKLKLSEYGTIDRKFHNLHVATLGRDYITDDEFREQTISCSRTATCELWLLHQSATISVCSIGSISTSHLTSATMISSTTAMISSPWQIGLRMDLMILSSRA